MVITETSNLLTNNNSPAVSVPNTNRLPRKSIMVSNDGKTLLTFLDAVPHVPLLAGALDRNVIKRTSSLHRIRRRKPKPLVCGKLRPENLLLILTLLAVVTGSLIGLYLNPALKYRKTVLSERTLSYIKFPGDIFLNSLKMLIIPLVIASNISSVSSLAPNAARWLAGLTMIYFISTSFIAVLIGTVLVLLIRPGVTVNSTADLEPEHLNTVKDNKSGMELFDAVLNLISSLVPANLISATFKTSRTKWVQEVVKGKTVFDEALNMTVNLTRDKSHDLTNEGTNILGLIMFSLFFGIAVRNLGSDAAILAELFHAIRRAIIYLVSIAMWFSPIGIMCLIAEQIAKEKMLLKSIRSLSLYMATVMTGLFIHGVIVLPLLLVLFARRNPFTFTVNMLQALICAMGTASSTATLPCTIKCLEKGNNIDNRVTRFMLPLGTTINMDGTVMYEAIAVIFIAQKLGYELEIGEILLVVLTSVLAGMAATSMPSAGLVTMAMVLMAVGLPDDKYKLIIAVDWFLDRFRTMVNVYGDAVGAAILSKLCEERLKQEPKLDESELPDPTQAITICPGGLQSIDISELNQDYDELFTCQNTPRRKSLSSRSDAGTLNSVERQDGTISNRVGNDVKRNRHSVALSDFIISRSRIVEESSDIDDEPSPDVESAHGATTTSLGPSTQKLPLNGSIKQGVLPTMLEHTDETVNDSTNHGSAANRRPVGKSKVKQVAGNVDASEQSNQEPPGTCMYMVDDDTVLLRF